MINFRLPLKPVGVPKMTASKSRLSLAFGASLLAATAVLAGCGPTPVTQTTTTTEQVTRTPPPVMPMQSTITTQTYHTP